MAGRAVLFDLDNTLHDRDAGLEAFARAHFASLDLAALGRDAAAWTRRFVELDARGQVWKDAVYRALREEFGLRPSVDELLAAYEDGFARHVRAAEGVRETLGALRARGWRLGVVTNGRFAFQAATLAALEIGEAIDAFVVSERCGFRKPAPEIFRLALESLEADAASSWFVGDDPVADIEGAANVGLQTAWLRTAGFRTAGQARPSAATCEIGALGEILGLVEEELPRRGRYRHLRGGAEDRHGRGDREPLSHGASKENAKGPLPEGSGPGRGRGRVV